MKWIEENCCIRSVSIILWYELSCQLKVVFVISSPQSPPECYQVSDWTKDERVTMAPSCHLLHSGTPPGPLGHQSGVTPDQSCQVVLEKYWQKKHRQVWRTQNNFKNSKRYFIKEAFFCFSSLLQLKTPLNDFLDNLERFTLWGELWWDVSDVMWCRARGGETTSDHILELVKLTAKTIRPQSSRDCRIRQIHILHTVLPSQYPTELLHLRPAEICHDWPFKF